MRDSAIYKNKIELDHGNYFIEYFYIIGLDQELIFEDFLYVNNIKTINESQRAKPCMISKFPDIKKSLVSIDNELILKHCFPNGLMLVEAPKTPPSESFSFTLDNLIYLSTYPKIYCNCLLFYECLENYYKLRDKYITSSNISLFDSISLKEKSEQNSDVLINVASSPLLIRTSEEKSQTGSVNNSVIIPFDIDNKALSRKQSNNAMRPFRSYFVPKVICFASLYPFIREQSKILRTLYNYVCDNSVHVTKPLEKIIENLIMETPVPPKGCLQVEYHLFNEKYILTQSPHNVIPTTSLELDRIFKHFKVDAVLEIVKCMLLEIQMIFFSNEKHNLSSVLEGILTLLSPFKYKYPNVSVIPLTNLPIIEMYNTSIVGINFSYSDSFFKDFHLEVAHKSFVIVDIDHSQVISHLQSSINMESISLKDINKTEQGINVDLISTTDLPKHYKFKLSEKVKSYLHKIREADNKEEKETFNKFIKESFFYFMISILKDYARYLLLTPQDLEKINEKMKEKQSIIITDLFKTEEFLSYCHHLDQPFYKRFLDTKMFFDFILRKMFPKEVKDKMEILFIDESIANKKNKQLFSKSTSTPVINSAVFEIKSTYLVPKSRGFSQEEVDVFLDPVYIKKGLKYGQDISNKDGQLTVAYLLFPKLLYDNSFFGMHYCDQYVKNKIQFQNYLREEVESKCNELLAQSNVYLLYSGTNYTFDLSNQLHTMHNYVLLCWIEMFALSFWYCDSIEKPFRFQQMLDVLEKVEWIDEETFFIVFVSLYRFGEDPMLIKLYEQISSAKITPNYTAFAYMMEKLSANTNCSILSNKIPAANRRSTLYLKDAADYSFYEPDYSRIKFNQRTFKIKADLSGNEEVQFESENTCVECQETFDLAALCHQFDKIGNELFWALCPLCNRYIMPKMKVKLGNSSSGEPKIENFVLYSPSYLKYYYSLSLLKECELKLDMKRFRKRFTAIFWNSLWWFSLKGLKFDFMLPYKHSQSRGTGRSLTKIFSEVNGLETVRDNNCNNIIPIHKEQLNLNFNNMEISTLNPYISRFANLEIVNNPDIFLPPTDVYYVSKDDEIRSSFVDNMEIEPENNKEYALDLGSIRKKYRRVREMTSKKLNIRPSVFMSADFSSNPVMISHENDNDKPSDNQKILLERTRRKSVDVGNTYCPNELK